MTNGITSCVACWCFVVRDVVLFVDAVFVAGAVVVLGSVRRKGPRKRMSRSYGVGGEKVRIF